MEIRRHSPRRSKRGLAESVNVQGLLKARGDQWTSRAATLRAVGDPTAAVLKENVEQAALALIALPDDMAVTLHETQWVINDEVSSIIRDVTKRLEPAPADGLPTRPPVLVVVIGYSKAVRDVIKTALFSRLGKNDSVFVVRMKKRLLQSRIMGIRVAGGP